jgi:signal transduction histidine kinase
MVLAGFYAISVLRRMHVEEEQARQNFLLRTQLLSTLCSSLEQYSDRVQILVLRPNARITGDLDRLADELESALRRYPRPGGPEERELIASMQETVERQQQLLRSLLSLNPATRQLEAPRILLEEWLPVRSEVLECSQKLRMWNSRQYGDAGRLLLARFDSLQSSLMRLLLVALGSGLLLAVGSMIYIGTLERDAEHRYGEMKQLSARLLDAQESERRSISRELHDEVGQSLGALLVDLARVSARAPEGLREELAHMKSVTETTVQTVRNIALLLRPSMLDDLGLVPALEWQAREVSRRTELEVDVRAEGIPEALPDEYNVCIYRLVQEALNNASRHAAARNAHVEVVRRESRIAVCVRDDGRGFEPQRTRGLGILGMEERVKRLGGSFAVESRPGQGTTVRADLPLPPGAAA